MHAVTLKLTTQKYFLGMKFISLPLEIFSMTFFFIELKKQGEKSIKSL